MLMGSRPLRSQAAPISTALMAMGAYLLVFRARVHQRLHQTRLNSPAEFSGEWCLAGLARALLCASYACDTQTAPPGPRGAALSRASQFLAQSDDCRTPYRQTKG